MARIVLKAGDIFAVSIGEEDEKYFQYIGDDSSQLDSQVIRIFKNKYIAKDINDLNEIANSEIDCHAHCFLKAANKLNLWRKIGNGVIAPNVEILFRDTYDYGRASWQEPILVSHNWIVWSIGQEFQQVGELMGNNRKADIGLVMSPSDIIHRITKGFYIMPFYPAFS